MINKHIPVMLKESIAALNIKADGCYFDATFGRGGHSRAILDKLDDDGFLYATDRDPSAIEVANDIDDGRFVFRWGNFSCIKEKFPELGRESLDGALLDLGVSSPQLDEAKRGFSFSRDGSLDMRMNPKSGISAKEFINDAKTSKIANVIAHMGEERFAKQIAKKIAKVRLTKTITTTKQLAEIVSSAVPARFHTPGRHVATRTFQAIRIYINDELNELNMLLEKIFPVLKSKGRLVVISFHSLEDKCVKDFIKKFMGQEIPSEVPVTDPLMFKKVKLIGRLTRPSRKEVANNPRSRSSLMRVVEKL